MSAIIIYIKLNKKKNVIGDFQKEFQFCPATAFIETGGQPFLFKKC